MENTETQVKRPPKAGNQACSLKKGKKEKVEVAPHTREAPDGKRMHLRECQISAKKELGFIT